MGRPSTATAIWLHIAVAVENRCRGWGPFKGIVSKFWNFLYYWSDLTEIFTQYVKSKKKQFLFVKIFPFRT